MADNESATQEAFDESQALMQPVSFEDVASDPSLPIDACALALAAEFGEVGWREAGEHLDRLGREVADCLSDRPRAPHREAAACRVVLGERHEFAGDTSDYGDPRNSMLDAVLARGTGLPITLSIVWIAVAARAGFRLEGVGLPGHYVVGHFGADPPLLLDPFAGGVVLEGDPDAAFVRPCTARETVLRMLNNLVRSYVERGDLTRALHAANLRLPLSHGPEREGYAAELTRLEARLN
jgi:regulator of sirC expression with transglutaminase-like and TPR domain